MKNLANIEIPYRRRTRRVMSALLLLGSALPAFAADVAVLWDVSKSVPPALYGDPVKECVISLISGHGVAAGWEITMPVPPPLELGDVVGGRRAMAEQGDTVLVVPFGNIRGDAETVTEAFPTREVHITANPDTYTQVRDLFPGVATDQWTNKHFAEAAAAKYFSDRDSSGWYVITISDFNHDAMAPLTTGQQQIVDRFRARQFLVSTPSVILRAPAERRFNLEVWHAKKTPKPPYGPTGPRVPPPPPQARLEGISPRAGVKAPTEKPLTFSWIWNGPEAPLEYHVQVNRIDVPGTVPRLSTSGTSVSLPKGLPAGRYRWQVFAIGEAGSVASSPVSFEVVGGGDGKYIVLAGLAVLAGAITFILNRRRRQYTGA